MSETLSFDQELYELVRNDKWTNILKLNTKYQIKEINHYLWAWPTEECLNILNKLFKKKSIKSLLSIGCGSGLLEWIIQKSTGIDVYGLELDKSWWTSRYSPQTFIHLNFVSMNKSLTSAFLRNCASSKTDYTNVDCVDVDMDDNEHNNNNKNNKYALLFCYFNDRKAFNEYVRAYDGDFIIIIGPERNSGTITDPQSLKPEFETHSNYQWLTDTIINIDNFNYIGVYRKSFY